MFFAVALANFLIYFVVGWMANIIIQVSLSFSILRSWHAGTKNRKQPYRKLAGGIGENSSETP